MAKPKKPLKVLRADFAKPLELIGSKQTVSTGKNNEVVDAGSELILISRKSKRVLKVPKSTVAIYEVDYAEFMAEFESAAE